MHCMLMLAVVLRCTGVKATQSNAPAAAGAGRFGPSGMFSQRKTPAADATSTLLNFLKQEQALVSSSPAGKASEATQQGQAAKPNAE